jgi:outer membrane receptor protein involved in Fe transport
MRLVRPKATIDIAADGIVDWAIRPSSPFDPGQISIEKLTVTAGVDNLTDEKPPILYQNNVTNANTDVQTYDTIGTYYRVGLKYKF